MGSCCCRRGGSTGTMQPAAQPRHALIYRQQRVLSGGAAGALVVVATYSFSTTMPLACEAPPTQAKQRWWKRFRTKSLSGRGRRQAEEGVEGPDQTGWP